MAYTYADWASQATIALQLSVLNQHIAEVAGRIKEEIGSGVHNRSSSSLTAYHKDLLAERDKLQAMNGVPRTRAYARRASFRS